MSWIAEYDTQGREFPTCVHVTKVTGTMTHGATYVPIDDGMAARAENVKLREQLQDAEHEESIAWDRVRSAERRNDKLRELLVDFRNAMWRGGEWTEPFDERMKDLGVEV